VHDEPLFRGVPLRNDLPAASLPEGAFFRPVVLDVGDPAFANVHRVEDERLALSAIVSDPVGANHKAVVTYRDELGRACSLMTRPGQDPSPPFLEDLTGLVGAASTGRVAPPEKASLDTPPLGIRTEKANELREVAFVRQLVRATHPLKRLGWHGSRVAASCSSLERPTRLVTPPTEARRSA
jgi:hypothetical protein